MAIFTLVPLLLVMWATQARGALPPETTVEDVHNAIKNIQKMVSDNIDKATSDVQWIDRETTREISEALKTQEYIMSRAQDAVAASASAAVLRGLDPCQCQLQQTSGNLAADQSLGGTCVQDVATALQASLQSTRVDILNLQANNLLQVQATCTQQSGDADAFQLCTRAVEQVEAQVAEASSQLRLLLSSVNLQSMQSGQQILECSLSVNQQANQRVQDVISCVSGL